MKNRSLKKFIQDKGGLALLLAMLLLATAVTVAVLMGRGSEGDGEDQYLDLDNPSEEVVIHEESAESTEDQQAAGGTAGQPDGIEVGESAFVENTGAMVAEGESQETEAEAQSAGAGVDNSVQASLNFSSASKMQWPIQGELVMSFDMEHTVYYPTLEQYKVCPAIMIQGEAGAQVQAAANGQVVAISSNEELGNYVEMDLGGGYHAVYGQLADVAVTEGSYVPAGTVFATLNSPTKYYVVEGPNLYFQLTLNGQPVDPVDYLQ